MRVYEPVAISFFTVIVLSACFLLGRSIGYKEGISQAELNTVNLSEQTGAESFANERKSN